MLHDIIFTIFLFWKPILGLILTFLLLFLFFKNRVKNLFVRIPLCFILAILIVFFITLYMLRDLNVGYW